MERLEKPIQSQKEDLFEHHRLASRIRQHIEGAGTEGQNIALYGGWGSGKTGILNVTRSIGNTNEMKWVDFDALAYQRHGSVLLPLMRLLYRQNHKDSSNAQKAFWRIARGVTLTSADILLKLATAGLTSTSDIEGHLELIEKLDEKLIPDSPADDLRESFAVLVDGVMEEGQKRVVIAIDNLDRCRPEAALEVIESIQLLSQTQNCSFLIAVDRDVLASFLERQYEGTSFDGIQYLEKIFTFHVNVPDPAFISGADDLIHNFILLKSGLKESKSSWQFWKPFVSIVTLTAALRNPRRIQRLMWRFDDVPEASRNGAGSVLVVFLLGLQEVWPRAFDYLRTSQNPDWIAFVKRALGKSESSGSGSIEASPELDFELRRFIQACAFEYEQLTKRSLANEDTPGELRELLPYVA